MPHIIATHNWMRPESIKRTIERMKQTGVDALEISGEPDQFNTKEVRALLKENGRTCWGSVTLTLGERNLAAKDVTQREKTVDYMKRVVTFAKELDGQIVTLVPATVGKVVADGTPEEEWKWLVDGVKEVYAHAEKAGIRIAIEPLNRFETYLINRGDQALALADAVGPNCGVCLDLFHMNIEESDIHEAFRKARGRIYDIHIADNNRFAPGMGTLDFPAIVKTIKETGYTGALTLEFVATVDRTPANPYGDQVEKNPVDVSPEQMKFIIDHGSNLLADTFYTGLFEQSVRVLRPLV
ncbi:MAG: sugar phosphate isomerase/epimerase family protein [Burkholderiales bacterium]